MVKFFYLIGPRILEVLQQAGWLDEISQIVIV